ncbi:MAG: hypothetical protein WA937_07955 [Flavobacteriales bacterium]
MWGGYRYTWSILLMATCMLSACRTTKPGAANSWPDAYADPNISVLFMKGGGPDVYNLDIDTAFVYKFYSKEYNNWLESIRYYYGDSMNSKMVRTFYDNGMIMAHADRTVIATDFLNVTGKGYSSGILAGFWPTGTMDYFAYFDTLSHPHGNVLDVDYDGTLRSNIIYDHGNKIKAFFYSKSGALDSLVIYH